MEITLLVEVRCRKCGQLFHVCRRCWRGQAYCSESCRAAARQKAKRQAQRRYRRTEKGRETHRKAERRRRLGRSKKTMDDHTSNPRGSRVTVTQTPRENLVCCHFCGACGVLVDRFDRRDYGRRAKARHKQSVVRRL